MHAYFPALNSFPSLLGDMISDAINCLGFTWASSPAATELETLVMDWLCKAMRLPNKFLSSDVEPYGGGVLQVSVIIKRDLKKIILNFKRCQRQQQARPHTIHYLPLERVYSMRMAWVNLTSMLKSRGSTVVSFVTVRTRRTRRLKRPLW